jgi:hypothetical protein
MIESEAHGTYVRLEDCRHDIADAITWMYAYAGMMTAENLDIRDVPLSQIIEEYRNEKT